MDVRRHHMQYNYECPLWHIPHITNGDICGTEIEIVTKFIYCTDEKSDHKVAYSLIWLVR